MKMKILEVKFIRNKQHCKDFKNVDLYKMMQMSTFEGKKWIEIQL